eukprot:TRINITY_DN67044_c0_g1_i1.p1 TRINITY_DN67044_c0_g1~~TRINITY_DN67044_c0_g1_i1.p1  ORF type:complete len:281 (+),score=54.22 TRINITY_DN67044_c0_g1_i1:94-936(+)
MGQKRPPGHHAEESDGELSESTRAVRQIQKELDVLDSGVQDKGRTGRERIERDQGPRGQDRRKTDDEPLGDGRTHGAITGIKLGEFALGASTRRGHSNQGVTAGVALRVKAGGKDRNLSLASLVSMANGDAEEERANAPEAPDGSYKRRDVERALAEGAGRPTSKRGIDGKVYTFVADPADGEADSSEDVAAQLRELKMSKKAIMAMADKTRQSKSKVHISKKKRTHKKRSASSSSDSVSSTPKKKKTKTKKRRREKTRRKEKAKQKRRKITTSSSSSSS